MAISGQLPIRIGQPNESANSDSLFQAFTVVQNNFNTLFSTASNISTVTAGNGIQVSSTTSGVTVTNTGVTKLVAGENVTITKLDGTSGETGSLVISSTGTGGNGGGTVTSVGISSNTLSVTNTPVIGAGNINVELPSFSNVAGLYRNPNLTVDSTGRITSISNGSNVAGTVTSVGISSGGGLSVSGGPITSAGNITITNTGVTSIVPGSGIQINRSNGAVTISATGGGGGGGGGTVTRVGVLSNSLVVTGSPIIVDGNITIDIPQDLIGNSITMNSANISEITSNDIYVIKNNNDPGIEIDTFSNDNLSSRIIGKKARGNSAVPLPIQSGDLLSGFQARGLTQFNNYQTAGGIDIRCEGTPANSSSLIPSKINIYCTDANNVRQDITLNVTGDTIFPGRLTQLVYSNLNQTSTFIQGRLRGSKTSPGPLQVGDSVSRNFSFGYTGNGLITISSVPGFSFSSGTYSSVAALPSSNGQSIPSDYHIVTTSNSNVSLEAVFTHTGNFVIPETLVANGANINGNVVANLVTGVLTTGVQPNITSIGTLGNLSVSGNVVANNFIGNFSGNIQVPGTNTSVIFNDGGKANSSTNFTFNKSSNTLTVTGNVAANLFTGVLTTGTQPNITGVGTLTNLAVGGNITSDRVTANLFTGVLVTGAQPNITSVGTLTNLTVSGNIAADRITANLFTGLLTTGTQPNITGVGTLSSLSVSGNTIANNISANNNITSNLFTGTLVTGAQPNITSVGTLTSLSVSGNTTVNNLSSNGNVTANLIQLTGDATANTTVTVTATYPIVIDGIAYKLMLTQ